MLIFVCIKNYNIKEIVYVVEKNVYKIISANVKNIMTSNNLKFNFVEFEGRGK